MASETKATDAPVVDDGRILQDSQALTVAGAVQNIPVNQLYRENNVRTPATLRLPEMIVSIKRHGFKPNHPLVVSKKRDGRFLVLCGNRRAEAIEAIFADAPEDAGRLFPSGCVPCVVYTDLTEESEALLRIDHGKDEDRVPLDEYGEFLAIRQLVRAGYDTQTGIAEKMGWFVFNKKTGKNEPARSRVQRRVELALLPQFVQDEMKRYCEDSAQSNLRWSGIPKLYKAYNEEFRQYPNGDGPVFQAAWAEAVAPATTVVKVKPITPAELEKRAKLAGSALLRETLLTVVGIGEENLSDLDGRLVMAEAAQATLTEIADYLGREAFSDLCQKAQAHAKADSAVEVG